MKRYWPLILVSILAGPAYADWQPDPADDLQLAADATLGEMRGAAGESFASLFDEAYAFIVFPRLVRNGLIFGWASGTGILVEDEVFTGYVRQRRLSLGMQIGRQTQGQIILFRDQGAVEAFKTGGLEFTPQASAHVAKPRRAADASFRPSVAVFSLSKKGAMVEAAVGTTAFEFIPP